MEAIITHHCEEDLGLKSSRAVSHGESHQPASSLSHYYFNAGLLKNLFTTDENHAENFRSVITAAPTVVLFPLQPEFSVSRVSRPFTQEICVLKCSEQKTISLKDFQLISKTNICFSDSFIEGMFV